MRNLTVVMVVSLLGCSEESRPEARRTRAVARSSQVVATPQVRTKAAPLAAAPLAAAPLAAAPLAAVPRAAAPTVVERPTAGAAPIPALTVVDATFTHGVEQRAPIDRVSQFRPGERMTYLVVVQNAGEASGIELEWIREGKVIGRQTLAVGTSRGWRTWAIRNASARDVSTGVDVRVVDREGNELRRDHANVLPAGLPPSA